MADQVIARKVHLKHLSYNYAQVFPTISDFLLEVDVVAFNVTNSLASPELGG